MADYHGLEYAADEALQEVLAADLFEAGCDGVEELSPGRYRAFFPEALLEEGKAFFEGRSIPCLSRPIERRDWEAEWRASLKPVILSPRFTVTPSWLAETIPESARIIIDPKMAFGSGHHETTRICAAFLEENASGRSALLDLGTGTGILAIVGEKLGLSRIVALDNDPTVAANLSENIRLNRCTRIQPLIGTLETLSEKTRFDVVTCNILSGAILDLLEAILLRTELSSRIIFSGILATEKKALLPRLEEAGLLLLKERQDKEWYGLVAAKPIR